MARGNKKSSATKVTSLNEESAFAEPSAEDKGILARIKANTADLNSLMAFMRRLGEHTEGTVTGEKMLAKQNKHAVVQAFKQLPDYIRNRLAWEPVGPLDEGGVGNIPLYRGATKASSEFLGDTIVPFSTQKRVANKFNGYSVDYGGQKIYTLNDVESYKGGIDVRKISRWMQRLGRWDEGGPLSPSSGNPVYVSGSEHEVILYGVKWKDGVK